MKRTEDGAKGKKMSQTKTRTAFHRWGALALCFAAAAFSSPARAQTVTLGESLSIQDSTDTTQVEISAETIVEAIEIRVLGPGPDIQALIDGIADASAAKHYVIRLGPGEYPMASGLVMKSFVSLAGSGRRSTLLNAGDAIVNLVTGADNMSLTDMTIENAGGNTTTVAIFNNATSPTISRVTATASGGTDTYGVYNLGASPVMSDLAASASGGSSNYGVYNTGSSAPVMSDLTVSASGGLNTTAVRNEDSSPVMKRIMARASDGSVCRGVSNKSSSPVMTDVTATAMGAGSSNMGVSNEGSAPVMTNVTATASGGIDNRGVRNINGSSPVMVGVVATATGAGASNRGVENNNNSNPTMTNVTASASDADSNYGIQSTVNSSPTIKDSVATAENGTTTDVGIDGIEAATRVYNTLVIGGVANDAAGTQCQSVYDDTPAAIGC